MLSEAGETNGEKVKGASEVPMDDLDKDLTSEVGAEAAQVEALGSDEKDEASGETARDTGITAAVLVMVLFVRLLAVSGWDWATAADIADSFDFDDAVPIIFGTFFEMPIVTGIAASLILPLAIYRLYLMKVDPKGHWGVSDWFVVVLLMIVIFVLVRTFHLWWTVIIAVSLTIGLGFFARYNKKGTFHEVVLAVTHRTGTILIIGILVLSIVVTTPWNVKEVITTEHNGVIVGHVLETTPGFVKILTEDRDVIILLTGDIVSRESVEVER